MFDDKFSTNNKILCIDDDPQNSSLIKRVLEADGFDVLLATNGFIGLAQASRECPDLILLDIHMPGLNGYEVARNLRRMKQTRHIPIIFVSADYNPQRRFLGTQEGGDGYISKPIDVDLITEQIAAFL